MANSLEKSQKYLDLIIELYRKGSLTAGLETSAVRFDPIDANVIKMLRITSTGLGDYTRNVGYPKGDVTAIWDSYTLAVDRGARFGLDRLDEEEVLALTIGALAGQWTRDNMIPELDAFRFAKFAGEAGTLVDGTLAAATMLAAIDAAAVKLNNAEVPDMGDRLLFINQDLELEMRQALTRGGLANEALINTRIESYNGMKVVYVPSARFNEILTLNPGTGGSWGFTGSGKPINFMLLDPKAVWVVTRAANGKFITANENQALDSNEFMFRICHDAGAIKGREIGIYAHLRA